MIHPRRTWCWMIASWLLVATATSGRDEPGGWVDLGVLDAWRGPIEGWTTVGSAGLDPSDPKLLATTPGTVILSNGAGKAKNLISNQSFGDLEMHIEFNLPQGSNSGVKFQAVYEVQLFDSHASPRKPTGRECGGVYPRSEEKPRYHQIDDGYAPLVNASKPPGEWQEIDITFLAPRFDSTGKKVACARISAVLNGQKVQDNLEVHSPTGSAWRDTEKTTGPILLQADHGPVAFRNVRTRAIPAKP
jgi:hypothetical protein